MPLRMILVRHASTPWTRERRLQGTRDIALSPEGRAQAEAVGRLLADRPLDAVYASPLARTIETARAIAASHGQEVRIHPAFADMSFGQWEGLTPPEIEARDPEEYRLWTTEPHRAAAPGGDSLGAVRERLVAGLSELRAAHRGQTVVLVGHGVPSRILILEALGLGLDRLWSVALSATSVSELEFRDDWTALHRMNTLVHLDGLPIAR